MVHGHETVLSLVGQWFPSRWGPGCSFIFPSGINLVWHWKGDGIFFLGGGGRWILISECIITEIRLITSPQKWQSWLGVAGRQYCNIHVWSDRPFATEEKITQHVGMVGTEALGWVGATQVPSSTHRLAHGWLLHGEGPWPTQC